MQEGCTVNQTVKYIARKWTMLILLELYKGEGHTRRFSELKGCLAGEEDGGHSLSPEERVYPH